MTQHDQSIATLLGAHPRVAEVAAELLARYPTRQAAADAAEQMRSMAYAAGKGGVLMACRFAAELIRAGWSPPSPYFRLLPRPE